MPIDIEFDRILSIGINYVGTKSELNGCLNDIINLRKNTTTKKRIIMSELSQNKNLIPTKKNILNQIKEFVKDVGPNEKLLFQYSGHGYFTRDHTSDEKDGRDETICPLDYEKSGDISDDQIYDALIKPLPEGCKLFCLMDCCHSGTILDLKYSFNLSQYVVRKRRKKIKKKRWTKSIDPRYQETKCQVICISGCRDNQTSADTWEDRQYQGAMTWALLKTLNNKSVDNYKNLMKNLLKTLKRNKYSQIPQISAGHNLNLQDPLWK